MIKLFSFLIILLSLISLAEKSKFTLLPLPVLGSAPETSWQVGLVNQALVNLHDKGTRSSVFKLSGKYTGLEQQLYELEWDYYFNQDQWVTRGGIYYYDFTEFYYGIGNRQPQSNEILFDFNRVQLNVMVLKKLTNNFFLGATYQYLDYSDIKPRSNDKIYDELLDGNVNSYGLSIQRDTRTNVLNPKNASYLEGSWNYNFFAGGNYTKFILDYRRYFPFLGNNVIAIRSLNILNTENAPYFDMGFVGGDNQARGYLLGRFRDQNMMTVQSEIRYFFDTFKFPIKFWFLDNPDFGFGFGLFGGISNVFDEFSNFFNRLKPNYGIGLKMLIVKENEVYIRFDYGVGVDGQSGFYIKFGESF